MIRVLCIILSLNTRSYCDENPRSGLFNVLIPGLLKNNKSRLADEESPQQLRQHTYSRHDKGKVMRIDLDIPLLLNKIERFTGVKISNANSKRENDNSEGLMALRHKEDSILDQKLRFEVKSPDLSSLTRIIGDALNSLPTIKRRVFDGVEYGFVELNPGVVKSPMIDYPPNFEASQLKHLLYLKKKREGKQ